MRRILRGFEIYDRWRPKSRNSDPLQILITRRQMLVLFASFLTSASGCISVELRSSDVGDRGGNPGPLRTSDTQSGQWHQTTSADFQAGMQFKTKVLDVGDGAVTLEDGAQEGVFTSSVKQTDFAFNAFGITQNSRIPKDAHVEIEVRTSQNGKDWSGWVLMQGKIPSKDVKDDAEFRVTTVKASSFIQYRALLSSSGEAPALEDVTITYVDSGPGPNMQEAKNATLPKAAGQPTIISREGWGANKKYRYDDKGNEVWPEEYRRPVKLVIHHTLTDNDDDNPPATVRAIYYYHAITLGWGDIGYHYLVDAAGNIYEGRRGDGVVGGHAYGHNYGSIGIAVLGNYQAQNISDATRKSLVELLTWLCDKHAINPTGHSFFVDRDLQNIYGHRDSNPTTCPGDNLYNSIHELRKATLDQVRASTYQNKLYFPFITKNTTTTW